MVLCIILAREFAVSGLRMVAAGAKDGKVIAANMWCRIVIPGDAERLSRCAYRFQYEVNDFVQSVFIHVRVLYENVILDIVLDDVPVNLYCALRFRFRSFPFRLCRVLCER